MSNRRTLLAQIATLALAAILWWSPPPEGLALQAWRLFAIFATAIVSVVAGALPILTASVFAVAAAVLTGLLRPEDAYAGFANGTILLIVVAFLVAGAVVKCGLSARGGYWMVSRFGRSTLGLSYSLFLLDAVIAPAFPSNTARSGVLYPLALSLADAAGAKPDRADRRRVGAFLMYSGIASLSVSSALWLTAMAANPLGTEIARGAGVSIGFGTWLLAAIGIDSTAVAFLGLGALLATGVITLQDIGRQGDVLATFIWFAVLFTLSGQLNEMGFMSFLGRHVAAALSGLAAPTAGLILVAAYIVLHFLFVSQTAHMLALLGVFLDVGVQLGVNPFVLAMQLLFATNYFSVITPQGSSANLLFAGSPFFTQGDLYKLGAITTGLSFLVYAIVGTAWLRLLLLWLR